MIEPSPDINSSFTHAHLLPLREIFQTYLERQKRVSNERFVAEMLDLIQKARYLFISYEEISDFFYHYGPYIIDPKRMKTLVKKYDPSWVEPKVPRISVRADQMSFQEFEELHQPKLAGNCTIDVEVTVIEEAGNSKAPALPKSKKSKAPTRNTKALPHQKTSAPAEVVNHSVPTNIEDSHPAPANNSDAKAIAEVNLEQEEAEPEAVQPQLIAKALDESFKNKTEEGSDKTDTSVAAISDETDAKETAEPEEEESEDERQRRLIAQAFGRPYVKGEVSPASQVVVGKFRDINRKV